MKSFFKPLLAATLVTLPPAVCISQAYAQAYPAKPIRIYTSAPAGPYDIVLRGISPSLQQGLEIGRAHV